MAIVQKELITFHSTIKVEEDDLRKSRDALLDKIVATLKEKKRPVPSLINQGSYIYGVGIEPIKDLEHDIDSGLEFPVSTEEYPDPNVIIDWVYEAVEGHTKKKPEKKNPCIRVFYQAGYHVDLVSYAKFKSKSDKEADTVARQLGFKDGSWRPSEPKKLKKHILDSFDRFSDTKVDGDGNQLQRVTRYFKRWNDEAMPYESNDKPVGLAILLYCIENLDPKLDKDGNPDDLTALESIAFAAKATVGRIVLNKPTQEFEDIFGKISDDGMEALKNRFAELYEAILLVNSCNDLEEACRKMVDVFGDDFPITRNKRPTAKSDDSDRALESAVTSIPSSEQIKPWSQ